ncbi:MAG: S8 family serine peptidase [Pseudomonadota bacterium]
MAKQRVLLEFTEETPEAFGMHASSVESDSRSASEAERRLDKLAGLGVDIDEDTAPVPMFKKGAYGTGLEAFSSREENADMSSSSTVVAAEVPKESLEGIEQQGVQIWPNSEMSLFASTPYDEAPSRGGVDCRPFRPGAEIETIREILGATSLFRRGFRGQNIFVGILDEGVSGEHYPVVGGFSRPNAGRRPGTADVTSHGSMCAADVLISAPAARIYDYPFLGVPRSGGALQMFQAVLNQRRIDGTPHLTNNSYGFVGVPDPNLHPRHEVHDLNHPLHRKVREVVSSGCTTLFAAGNCGANCPSGNCHRSGIGPGRSIHASNSLDEVITVAAINSRNERVGYSSQGPGMFAQDKPDIASYSHIFANFGPDRPGGLVQPFDNGTSAATPVAAGVVALLLSAFPNASPAELKEALVRSAYSLGETVGFDYNHGHGAINAGASFQYLANQHTLFA